LNLEELLNKIDIGEDKDTEFKSAKGGLPRSLWETLSAFANTDGGYLVLGVDKNLEIEGVVNPGGLLKTFWDGHNNPQKVSYPVCSQPDIQVLTINSTKKVVVIHVPRVHRSHRPVYINGNPMLGTYKRNFEGDYRCTEEEVRQMLRDADNAPQDQAILENFDMVDLDAESLRAYRQRFASREPDHPFLAFDDKEFLYRLGGWHRDRKTGHEGVTIAGLLMFGKERSILDALPHYHLDYQEQLSSDPNQRWTYRLTLNGSWEPNLFNFYFRVYSRLVSNLDLPFELDKDTVRRGETRVHEALREALVNTLIHADHLSSRPIVVIKRPDAFLFSNPGRLRIPLARLYEGGASDPRNPHLQRLFQMLGLGEKAGSGFQKILRAWREQAWIRPLVSEKLDLEITSVALPMISMIPENVESELRGIVGAEYNVLSELDRIVLVLAHRFGAVTNADIQQYRSEHPREIGECLKTLTHKGWLKSSGHGRGTRYQLGSSSEVDLFSADSEHYRQDSEHYRQDSEHYQQDSEHKARFLAIAAPVREKGRAGKSLVEKTILELCADSFLSLRTLADLLNREPDSVRNHYVGPMVKRGDLEARYPAHPNHPQQGYRTVVRA
jgi:ATP-dependent DNA helicase RecG